MAWSALGLLAGVALVLSLSLPKKYAMTVALGLIAIPGLLMVRDREKVILALFLLTLPLSQGYMLAERLEAGRWAATFTLKVYLSDVCLISLALIQLYRALWRRRESDLLGLSNELSIPLVLWIGTGVLSLIPAIDRTVATVEIISMLRIALTFVCVSSYLRARDDIPFIMKCLLWTLLGQACLMFGQYLTGSLVIDLPGFPTLTDVVEEGLRPSGTMGHSGHFAKLSGLLLPVALSLALLGVSPHDKLFGALVWILGSVALVLTLSRAGLLGWGVSGIFLAMCFVVLRLIRLKGVLFICTLLVLASALLYLVGGQILEKRMADDAGSAASRLPMWQVAWSVIKAHPLLGVGLGNYTLVHEKFDRTRDHISVVFPHPVHNLFLLYAAEIGIPGLLLFVWFIWRLLKRAWRGAKDTGDRTKKAVYVGMLVGVVALLIQSLGTKGVADHLVHLSVVAVFGACVNASGSN